MLCLALFVFYLTKLSHDSSAPGGFGRPGFLAFARWCPAQGNIRDTSKIRSQYVAQPSDLSVFDFHWQHSGNKARDRGGGGGGVWTSHLLIPVPSPLLSSFFCKTLLTRCCKIFFNFSQFPPHWECFLLPPPVPFLPPILLGSHPMFPSNLCYTWLY